MGRDVSYTRCPLILGDTDFHVKAFNRHVYCVWEQGRDQDYSVTIVFLYCFYGDDGGR